MKLFEKNESRSTSEEALGIHEVSPFRIHDSLKTNNIEYRGKISTFDPCIIYRRLWGIMSEYILAVRPTIIFLVFHLINILDNWNFLFPALASCGNAMRRSRSFKVTDFSTNRKFIYDFLLVININLPPILHRLRVMVKFSLARGECLTFTLWLGVIPCQYRRKWSITKNLIISPAFPLQKVSVYLQPLIHNPPRNLPNSVKLRYN